MREGDTWSEAQGARSDGYNLRANWGAALLGGRPYKTRGGLLLPGVIYRVWGTRRQLFGIAFQRFHDLGDAAL
jgi:hypothetical protein